jgi:hypothetical protein
VKLADVVWGEHLAASRHPIVRVGLDEVLEPAAAYHKLRCGFLHREQCQNGQGSVHPASLTALAALVMVRWRKVMA